MEKVIKALECCKRKDGNECKVCPYTESEYCTEDMATEALALLKEQGTVPVKEDKINKCECGETVCRYWHPKFCGFCGRELLWY